MVIREIILLLNITVLLCSLSTYGWTQQDLTTPLVPGDQKEIELPKSSDDQDGHASIRLPLDLGLLEGSSYDEWLIEVTSTDFKPRFLLLKEGTDLSYSAEDSKLWEVRCTTRISDLEFVPDSIEISSESGTKKGRFKVEIRKATEVDLRMIQLHKNYCKASNLYKTGKYDDALVVIHEIIESNEGLGDSTTMILAKGYNLKGLIYFFQRAYTEAKELLLVSLGHMRKTTRLNDLIVANTLKNLAMTCYQLGIFQEAFTYAQEAEGIYSSILGEGSAKVGETLNLMGVFSDFLGDYTSAVKYLEQTWSIYSEIYPQQHPYIINTLNNLGLVTGHSGQLEVSFAHYVKALNICEQAFAPPHPAIAQLQANLGKLLGQLGRYEESLNYLHQAVDVYSSIEGAEREQGEVLQMLSFAYGRLDNYDKAIKLLNQSIEIKKRIYQPNHPMIADSVEILGSFLDSTGLHAQAIEQYQTALSLNVAAFGGKHIKVGNIYNSMAMAYDALEEYEKGIRYLALAKQIVGAIRPPTHTDLANINSNIATIYRHAGELKKSLYYCLMSAGVYPDALGNDHPLVATIYNRIANTYEVLGQNELSILFAKESVNVMQRSKEVNKSLEDEVFGQFVKEWEYVYRQLIKRLNDQARHSEAEYVLGLLKTKEYEMVSSQDPGNHFPTIPLSERETHVRELFSEGLSIHMESTLRYLQLLEQKESRGLSLEEMSEMEVLDMQLTVFYSRLEEEMHSLTFSNTVSLPSSVFDREILPDHIAYLKTTLGNDFLDLNLSFHDKWVFHRVEIGRKAVVELLQSALPSWRDPSKDEPRMESRQLYQWLIEPIRNMLDSCKVSHLRISLDGPLRYIPIAALIDSEDRYLVESYSLSVGNLAATTHADIPSNEWKVRAMGTSRAVLDLPTLAAVPLEIDGVVKTALDDPFGSVNGEIYLDDSFTRPVFLESLESGFALVHVATHYIFEPGYRRAPLSRLVMGDGSTISLRELMDPANSCSGIRLIALSACETALNSIANSGSGIEIESLATTFLSHGALNVLATLWSIEDFSTAGLMMLFYRSMDKSDFDPATALRLAQLDIFRTGGEKGEKSDLDREALQAFFEHIEGSEKKVTTPDYSHPFYWASFILMDS